MKNIIYLSFAILFIVSCSTTTQVSFLCKNEDFSIFVNDEYVGKGLVHYTAPKNVTTAEVQCKKDGITVYSNTYNLKGNNNKLFDINIPERLSYSSDRQIKSK